MYIAAGFPKSSREDGGEILYFGLDRAKMTAACEAAAKSGKYASIGKIQRPVWQKHSLEKPVVTKNDCSPARNAAVKAHTAALAAGKTPEEALVISSQIHADGAKAEAVSARKLAEDEGHKFELIKSAGAKRIELDPMNANLKAHVRQVEAAANIMQERCEQAAEEAEARAGAAAETLEQAKEALKKPKKK